MEPEEETSVEQLELETEGPQELDIYRDYDEDLLIGVQRTQAVALTAIVCVSFLGNIFVLCSLCGPRYSARPSRRIMKQLLCHLCIGDLAYAILTILPRTINILTFPRFYGGYVVCRMVKFLQLVPVYVCPFLTVACTVERYSSLRRNKDDLDPMALANRRRISWRESRSFAHVLSFWAWLSAMVLSAPNILAFRYEYLDDAGTVGACVYQVREAYERLWMTFLTCATWLVPLLLIAALTTIALSRYYMKRRRRKRSAAVGEVRENVDETEDVRLMRFFALLILAKYILWTPFNVTNIVGSYWRATMIGKQAWRASRLMWFTTWLPMPALLSDTPPLMVSNPKWLPFRK